MISFEFGSFNFVWYAKNIFNVENIYFHIISGSVLENSVVFQIQ